LSALHSKPAIETRRSSVVGVAQDTQAANRPIAAAPTVDYAARDAPNLG
jgi:hypothetical protein